MAGVKIPLTKAHKEQIKVALAIYNKCNDTERKFLDTCKKIAVDPENWTMTVGREKFLANIVKQHVTGEDTNKKTEYHNGRFHAYETAKGFQVYVGEIAIGDCVQRVEVNTIIAFLEYNIDSLLAAHAVTEADVDKLKETVVANPIQTSEDASLEFPPAEEEAKASDGMLYESDDSPSGYVDSNGVPVDEYCEPLEAQEDDLPYTE